MRIRALREDTELRHGHRPAEPLDQGTCDLAADPRKLVEQGIELPVIEDDEPRISISGGGRSPRTAVDQRDLAKEVTRSEPRQPPTLALDEDVAVDDHEKLIA